MGYHHVPNYGMTSWDGMPLIPKLWNGNMGWHATDPKLGNDILGWLPFDSKSLEWKIGMGCH
eukprot:3720582-Amphidinium_carterae.1